MPHDADAVHPGDLITAETFNRLVAGLEDLEARTELLEASLGGAGLAITARIPGGPYRIGDELQIVGRGFEFTSGATRVFFDSVRVPNLSPFSTDQRLVLTIPPVSGVVEAGTEVQLTVGNSTDTVSDSVILRPEVGDLTGNVDLEWLAAEPAPIEAGQPATFRYRIRSRASRSAVFALTADVDTADAAVWRGRLRLLDEGLAPLEPPQIRLDPRQEAIFHLRITSIPAGTSGTPFSLIVDAVSGGVRGSSGLQPFEVGAAAEPVDDTILLNPSFSIPPAALVGDTLTVAPGSSVRLAFAAELTVDGTYQLIHTALGAGSGWTVTRFLTPESFTVPPLTRSIQFQVAAAAGASPNAQLEVRLRRQGETASKARTIQLATGT